MNTIHPERTHPDEDSHVTCDVCAHQMTRHDPIALRFCRATQANAVTRNCICRVR